MRYIICLVTVLLFGATALANMPPDDWRTTQQLWPPSTENSWSGHRTWINPPAPEPAMPSLQAPIPDGGLPTLAIEVVPAAQSDVTVLRVSRKLFGDSKTVGLLNARTTSEPPRVGESRVRPIAIAVSLSVTLTLAGLSLARRKGVARSIILVCALVLVPGSASLANFAASYRQEPPPVAAWTIDPLTSLPTHFEVMDDVTPDSNGVRSELRLELSKANLKQLKRAIDAVVIEP